MHLLPAYNCLNESQFNSTPRRHVWLSWPEFVLNRQSAPEFSHLSCLADTPTGSIFEDFWRDSKIGGTRNGRKLFCVFLGRMKIPVSSDKFDSINAVSVKCKETEVREGEREKRAKRARRDENALRVVLRCRRICWSELWSTFILSLSRHPSSLAIFRSGGSASRMRSARNNPSSMPWGQPAIRMWSCAPSLRLALKLATYRRALSFISLLFVLTICSFSFPFPSADFVLPYMPLFFS